MGKSGHPHHPCKQTALRSPTVLCLTEEMPKLPPMRREKELCLRGGAPHHGIGGLALMRIFLSECAKAAVPVRSQSLWCTERCFVPCVHVKFASPVLAQCNSFTAALWPL